MSKFNEEIAKFTRKIENAVLKENGKAMRRALNAGAKEYKNIVKPFIPVLSKSTDFRQKGTVKNNLRHKTIIARDKRSGVTIIRIRRTKGRKMASIRANTKDRTDPFYWFLVDRGTKHMTGAHFMEKGKQAGEQKVIALVMNKYFEEMLKNRE